MRVVVQRVGSASVSVDGNRVAEIAGGLLVLVGVSRDDTSENAAVLADKLASLRIFPDEAGKMNRSVVDVGGAVLVVSQFTLLGDARRGRRPSFTEAARPEQAEPLVSEFARSIETRGIETRMGVFGAHMVVELANDGPVTLLIESRDGRIV